MTSYCTSVGLPGQVSIWFVYLLIIYYSSNKQTFACYAVRKNQADVLNALLGYPQWADITEVEVKPHPDITNEYVSFSGKDLYIRRGLYSRINNIGNTHVDVDNVYTKLYMVTNLLGCVYANVVYKFTTLIKNILSVISYERRSATNRVLQRERRSRKKKIHPELLDSEQTLVKRPRIEVHHDDQSLDKNSGNSEDKKQNSVDEEENKVYENVDDHACKILKFSIQQLLDSQKMFEYMHDALGYLLKLVPSEKQVFHPSINYVQLVLQLMVCYNNIPIRLERFFPSCTGECDIKNKSKCGQLATKLLKSINTKNQHSLEKFVNNQCILPEKDNQTIRKMLNTFQSEFPKKSKSDIMYQFEIQIKNLVNEVIDNYYLKLGFVYFKKFDNLS